MVGVARGGLAETILQGVKWGLPRTGSRAATPG